MEEATKQRMRISQMVGSSYASRYVSLALRQRFANSKMQKSQLVKNIGYRIRLRPVACRLNELGNELPPKDDDWIIISAADDGLLVSNVRTQHQFTLGYDNIHHFTSDLSRRQGEMNFGFLTLTVQIYLQGPNLSIQPTLRPGESLPPPQIIIREKTVDLHYPVDSGLQADLQRQGMRVSWVFEYRASRLIDLDGWQRVTVRDADGSLVQFRLKDIPHDQVLICRSLT